MKRLVSTLLVVAFACSWMLAATEDPIQPLVEGNNAFAFRLYGHLAKTDSNLLCSPFGISMALAMTSAGAAGKTLDEIRDLVEADQAGKDYHAIFSSLMSKIGQSVQKSGVSLRVRNSVWVNETIQVEPPFKSIMTDRYRANLFPVDFANSDDASHQINAWVSESTAGRISQMFDGSYFSQDTTLLWINTIFFQGAWSSRFQISNTRKAPFFVTPSRSVAVPMMNQKTMARYVALPDVTALELPYDRGGFSMIIFLPARKDGLQELEAALSAKYTEDLLRQLESIEVDVHIPKFAFQVDIPLAGILFEMGMKSAFDPAVADFSRIGSVRGAHVSAVLQRAGIEVNERGTTAWAGTAVHLEESMPPEPPVFLADHPFLFMILEKSSGTILFMGRVADPTVGGGR